MKQLTTGTALPSIPLRNEIIHCGPPQIASLVFSQAAIYGRCMALVDAYNKATIISSGHHLARFTSYKVRGTSKYEGTAYDTPVTWVATRPCIVGELYTIAVGPPLLENR